MDRVGKALMHVSLDGRGLEIGPSYNPLVPKSSGADVETVDHTDRDELVKKYRGWGLPEDKIAAIEPVDHVWNGGSLLSAIPTHGGYDYIIASHFLEHTVDLVGFLNDCEQLLRPGGRLALVLPDKRFCFDRFQPLSTVGDVVDAHLRGNAFHTAGTLLDHQAYACTRAGAVAWAEFSTDPLAVQFPGLEDGAEVIRTGAAQREYHDAHHWKFTPTSFRLLLNDLALLGYHSLGVVGHLPTDGFEFFVTLEQNGSWPPIDRLAELQAIEAELAEPFVTDRTAQLRSELENLQRANEDLRRSISEVLTSTSWRLTSPARQIRDAVRFVFK